MYKFRLIAVLLLLTFFVSCGRQRRPVVTGIVPTKPPAIPEEGFEGIRLYLEAELSREVEFDVPNDYRELIEEIRNGRIDIDTYGAFSYGVSTELNPGKRRILALRVEPTHGPDIEVIAEGLETRGQIDMLRFWGFDYGQGTFSAGRSRRKKSESCRVHSIRPRKINELLTADSSNFDTPALNSGQRGKYGPSGPSHPYGILHGRRRHRQRPDS